MGVNKVILLGNLGADPELKSLEGGSRTVVVSLATNEYYRSSDGQRQTRTTWHRLVFWDGLADRLARYARKGSKLYVEGRIDNRSYQDRDNQTRYISEIVVTTFEIVDGIAQGGEEPAPSGTMEGNKGGARASSRVEEPAVDFLPESGDLPFEHKRRAPRD